MRHSGTPVGLGMLWIALLAAPCTAQSLLDSTRVVPLNVEPLPDLIQRDLSGPRLGFTYSPDNAGRHGRNLVSQFGWHVESQIVPRGGGPQFIVEFVPLFAGVEYGKVSPSLSLGMGIRFPSGYEFGMGPSVALGRNNYYGVRLKSALFIAVGRTFDYGGVSLPLNLVVATNQEGSRISLIAGYAIRRASRRVGS